MKKTSTEELLGIWNQELRVALAELTCSKLEPVDGLPGVLKGVLSKDCQISSESFIKAALVHEPFVGSNCVAVGAIVDRESPVDRQPAEDSHLVIVIGINYWQFSSGKISSRDFLKTNMGAKVGKLIGRSKFTLIAANICPWISTKNWGVLFNNNFEEMRFLNNWIPSDMSDRLARLIENIKPHHVIFHGVDCAVPAYASDILKKLASNPRTNFLFSKNLGWTGGKVGSATRASGRYFIT